MSSAISTSPWALSSGCRTCALPRSPFVRDLWLLKTLSLKQQETRMEGEAINVSDRSSVLTSWEFGGCPSMLIPLRAWGSGKDLQPDVSSKPVSGSSLLLPISGPKKKHFPGLKVLATFSAKPCRPWPPGAGPAGITNGRAIRVLRDFLEFLAVE